MDKITPKKILLIRTDRLGDLILTTPVIKNIKAKFPKAYLAFLCQPYTKDVLEGNPYLDEIIVYDKKDKDKGFLGAVRFANFLRKKNFDLAIIFHPTVRIHLLTFFAGIRERIGWDRKKGWILTKRFKHNKQQGLKHEMEYNLDLLRYLNIPIIDKNIYFPLKQEAENRVKTILKEKGVSDKGYIVIHPCASCLSKRWPQEYYLKLVKLLKGEFNLAIIVITSKNESKFADLIISQEQVIDLRGQLDLKGLAALLKNAKLFISNDSGPVHVAAAFNTPVISIFGRKDPGLSPVRWGPLNEKSVYIHKDVGCDKCLAHACIKNFLCLQAIKPEEVLEKAKLFLLY